MKTLIWLILDRSGSMSGKEDDVIGGVNKFLEEQKKLPDPAIIGMTRFDNEYEIFRKAADLQKAEPIGPGDYSPRGSTALLDAVGRTLSTLDDEWKQHQPEKAIVVVITDGYENASVEFTKSKVKDMIESREKSGKWTFLYFGAGVDAFAEGAAMGFAAVNTAGYQGTKVGVRRAYATMSSSVGNLRTGGTSNLGKNLGESEDEDQQQVPAAVPPSVVASGPSTPIWQEPGKTWTPPAAA